jgi:hypothetical protein
MLPALRASFLKAFCDFHSFVCSCWGSLLRYCVSNHAYKGCALPPSLMTSQQHH